jgi:O-antigen/teichoic acid export membrane protein
MPILLKSLGKSNYGLYQLIGSIIAYMAVFDFGLSSTITRYYSKYLVMKDEKGKENILAITLILYGLLTILLVIVGLFIYISLDRIFSKSLTQTELFLAKKMFIILIINMMITIPANIFISIINAYEKFVFLKLLNMMQTVLGPIAIVLILHIYPSALYLVIIQALLNLAIIITRMYYCLKVLNVRIRLHNWDKQLVNELFVFAFFVFLTAVMDQIFWKTDQIILGVFVGTSSVAVYAIASQLLMNYMLISTTISGTFLPQITKMVASEVTDNVLSNLFIKIGRLQFLILSCTVTGFALFGKQFLLLWVGDAYSDAYYIILLIIIPFSVDLIQNIGLSIMQAKNLYSFRAKVFFAIAIVNIVMSIPLAIYFEGIGCAIASAISYFLGNILVMNLYYQKKVKIDIIAFWGEIYKISIPLFMVFFLGVVINHICHGNSILNLLLKIIIYISFYFILMFKFAMNEYEKSIISSLIYKISFQKINLRGLLR